MIHTGCNRIFRDPLDMRGLPTVTPHVPVPRREKPLPGTKTLLVPAVNPGFKRVMRAMRVRVRVGGMR